MSLERIKPTSVSHLRFFRKDSERCSVSSSLSDKIISTASRLSTLCREGCGLKEPTGGLDWGGALSDPVPEPLSEGTLTGGEKFAPVLAFRKENQSTP